MPTLEKNFVTRETVFEEADRLKAAGFEPSNRKLLQALGGSMTTIAGFLREWKAKQSLSAPAATNDLQVPATVLDAGNQAASAIWQICYVEARRETDVITEQANQRVKEAENDRDKVLVELSESETELAVAHARLSTLEIESAELRRAATVAAATEAALTATADQMGRQIEAQAAELKLVHTDHNQERLAHSAELARQSADFARQLAEHADLIRSARAEIASVRIELEDKATALQQALESKRIVTTDLAQALSEITRCTTKAEDAKAADTLVEMSLREQLGNYREQVTALTKQSETIAGERDALRALACTKEATLREQLAGLRDQVATLRAQHNAAMGERDALRGQVSTQLEVIAAFSNTRLDGSGATDGAGKTSKSGAKLHKPTRN